MHTMMMMMTEKANEIKTYLAAFRAIDAHVQNGNPDHMENEVMASVFHCAISAALVLLLLSCTVGMGTEQMNLNINTNFVP